MKANILKHLKVKFEGVNVLESNEMRQGIKDYTDWPTIPQLYIKGNFIGGRISTREVKIYSSSRYFFHGAQFFSSKTTKFHKI